MTLSKWQKRAVIAFWVTFILGVNGYAYAKEYTFWESLQHIGEFWLMLCAVRHPLGHWFGLMTVTLSVVQWSIIGIVTMTLLSYYRHPIKRFWCYTFHKNLGPTNSPPNKVCLTCGTWRILALLILCFGVAACENESITAPSADPVIIDDGGSKTHAEGNFSGGGSKTN